MKIRDYAATENTVRDERYYRDVSLAEIRNAMGDDEIIRLPAGGFRTPILSGSNVGMIFPSRMPMNYDGSIIYPRPTASSGKFKNLASALRLPGSLHVELWCGQFDFSSQNFLLTIPEQAEHYAAFVFDGQDEVEGGLPSYMLKYGDKIHPMMCCPIQVQDDDGNCGFLLLQSIDRENSELAAILNSVNRQYQERLRIIAEMRQVAAQQREHCYAMMAVLMQTAMQRLDWGWYPMTDCAWIYYIDGTGKAAEEVFYYVQTDVDYLRDLICIAEEATASGKVGDLKNSL